MKFCDDHRKMKCGKQTAVKISTVCLVKVSKTSCLFDHSCGNQITGPTSYLIMYVFHLHRNFPRGKCHIELAKLYLQLASSYCSCRWKFIPCLTNSRLIDNFILLRDKLSFYKIRFILCSFSICLITLD